MATKAYKGKKGYSNSKKSKPKSNAKFKDKDKQFDKPNDSLSGISFPHNDPNWYIYDNTMFNSVISMPTLEFKGTHIKLPTTVTNIEVSATAPVERNLNEPTCVAYYTNPSMGYQTDDFVANSINVMGRKIYAELSASNAKTSQYAPQDVTTAILALGQILAMVECLKRLYGITRYYNFMNRNTPNSLLYLHGVTEAEAKDWARNMPDLRNRINQIIARINSIHFPDVFNYFNKSRYMYSNIFVDRDDDMPTYQMFIPASTWIIDESSYPEGTILSTVEVFRGEHRNVFDVCDLVTEMIDAILTSATYNYMFSDIINLANRGYISSNWITTDMLDIQHTVEPLFSEPWNWQIMNATILGTPDNVVPGDGYVVPDTTPNNDIYPDVNNNCLIYKPVFNARRFTDANMMQKYIDSKRDLPIRTDNINISDSDFVELLAYHNIPHTYFVEGTGSDVSYDIVPGLSDYYIVDAKYCAGAYGTVQGTISANIGFTGTDDPAFFNMISGVTKMTNVVHSPCLGFWHDAPRIVSKLGTFMFINSRALVNLRFETFLGLFNFKK